MTNSSVSSGHTATLAATTVDNVIITQPFRFVKVTNVDGASAITFVVQAAGTAVVPTVGMDNAHYLPAVAGASEVIQVPNPEAVVEVSLISAATPKYSVEGLINPEVG
jgi:hypothetical protein